MNIIEKDILLNIYENGYKSQRDLSEKYDYSLGAVNKSIKNLILNNYLDENYGTTQLSKSLIDKNRPKNAVILAAGYGMRMVPINTEIPKALIEVRGEVLIERTIRQLKEAGVDDITVVVGFMKEKFEYLIDDFGVKLLVNTEYFSKNNLYSLAKFSKNISCTYIVPSDIYCLENPYSINELYSWYTFTDEKVITDFSISRFNEVLRKKSKEYRNKSLGIAYICEEDSKLFVDRLERLSNNINYDSYFWEEALFEGNKSFISAKIIPKNNAYEINTYEDLRDLDSNSLNLQNEAIEVIKEALSIDEKDIYDINILKKGMTNRSFIFSSKGEKYIVRIPGEGTSELISRKEESDVYKVITGKNICDDVIYMNPENGFKITKFINNSRVCDPYNMEDVSKCMEKLRDFHNMEFEVEHEFNIFEKIDYYESLFGHRSVYKHYEDTKKKVFSLKEYIEKNVERKILSHIDSVSDNFLFSTDDSGKESLYLIDWEYAAMQDPDVDLAMFSIYTSSYTKEDVDRLIDIYYPKGCSESKRTKIYAYISACGLLWSNWCEYKLSLGIEFGEYSLSQYRYAIDFYQYAIERINEENNE